MQQTLEVRIRRVHLGRAPRIRQRLHAVARAGIRHGTQGVPVGISFGHRHAGQRLQRLGKVPRLDKVHRRLILWADAGIALRAPTAIGPIATVTAIAARLAVTAGRTVAVGLAVFDRVIGRVDLVHFFRRVRVVRVQVRMIFLGQAAIGRLDLLFARVSGNTEDFIWVSHSALLPIFRFLMAAS